MPATRRLLAPLLDGLTYLRLVHLLLGAVLLLPYLALGRLLATAARGGDMDPVALALLLVPAVGGAVAVTLVPGVRSLEVAAARALLGVRLPDPDPATAAWWPVRRRSAGYLVAAMLLGGLVAVAILVAIPSAVGFLIAPWRTVSALPAGPRAWWAPVVGVLILVALSYLVAGTGALLARLARLALSPTRSERMADELAAAQRAARELAERNRLARELHDSVGHALTVTVLQAEAAGRMMRSDPESARRALDAIAETGRGALGELDEVLGVLRDDAPAGPGRTPQPDLSALQTLLAGTRSAGLPITATVRGPLSAVPAAVSRESFRIVQEALTNALRHAGAAPVRLDVQVGDEAVTVHASNPLSAGVPRRPGGGRGLAGMAERIRALRGELTAGERDGHWVVHARLPVTSDDTGISVTADDTGHPVTSDDPGNPVTAERPTEGLASDNLDSEKLAAGRHVAGSGRRR